MSGFGLRKQQAITGGSISRRHALATTFAGVWTSEEVARAQATEPGIYFDSDGLIVQRDGDGGDTAQREGWAWFAIKLREHFNLPAWSVTLPHTFPETLDKLEVGASGRFRRHPTQGGWKSDPNAFSRDQATPLIAAMGLWGDRTRLERSWAALTSCNLILSCVQGTADVAGPDYINLFRRGLGEAPDPNGDAFLYLGTASRLIQAKANPEDVGDDLNLVVQLLAAMVTHPTPASELARRNYAKNRPVCAGSYLRDYRRAYPGDFLAGEATMKERIRRGITSGWRPEGPPVLGALRWYFRAESGGCSSLAELYAPLIDKFLS